MFLYRPEYYDITSNEMGESNRVKRIIRIAKHRNGMLETIKLRALLHIQKFVEDDGSGLERNRVAAAIGNRCPMLKAVMPNCIYKQVVK